MGSLINLLQTFPLSVLIILSGISLIIGDLFAKSWSTNHNNLYFLISILFYIFYGIFFIPTLTKEGLVISAITVVILNVIGFVFIGLVLFQESLSPLQILGLLLGIVSVIFLESH